MQSKATSVTYRCTKIKAGEFIELANGILIRNPTNQGIRLVIETPNQSAKSEAQSHESPKKSSV